jgi:hypothetical protein
MAGFVGGREWSGVMQALGALYRSRLRRHWRAWVAVVLLLGLGAGAGFACLAGARRTASWFDRVAQGGGVPDINSSHGLPPRDAVKTVEGFEGVAAHGTVIGFTGYVEGIDRTLIKYFIGEWDEPLDVQRPILREGRYPRPDVPTEILVAGRGADAAGLRPGSELSITFFLSDFSGTISKRFVVTGIGAHVAEALSDSGQDRSGVYFTPAFSAANDDRLRAWSATAIVAEPGREADVVEQVLDAGWSLDETRGTTHRRVQDALRPLLVTLSILGVLLIAAALVLAAQALARQSVAGRRESEAVRAIGFTRRQLVAADVLAALSVALLGAVLAVVVAALLSPLAPVGAVRPFEPERGLDLDLVVLGFGALALVAVIVGAQLVGRALSVGVDESRARPLFSRATLGPALSGLRLATGGTRTQRRQFWATVAFSALALVLVVAGIAFAGALGRLTAEPVRYGVGWELSARAAYGDLDPDDLREQFGDDPDIDGVAAATVSALRINGETVPLLALLPVTGALWPTIVDGETPDTSGEILVGESVLAAIDANVGDVVTVSDPYLAAGPKEGGNAKATIVGTAVFPSIDLAGVDPTRLDQGVAMTWEQFQSVYGESSGGLPDLVFIDLRKGVDPHEVIARYPDGLPELTGIAPTEWLPTLAPAEILEADRATPLVWSVIALLAVTVLGTLAHTLASGVRRHRSDYAVLKTLGFTRRQVITAVTSQSIVTIAVALVIAVPAGTALGRALWRAFAQIIGVINTPVVPLFALSVLAVGALACAALVGAAPGILAARTRPAAMLHEE